MGLLADIFITVKPTDERRELTCRSIESLVASVDPTQVRLTICLDGRATGNLPLNYAEYILTSTENEGLGPTINRAVAHIKSINDWYSDPRAGDPNLVAPFIVGCQDDCLYEKGWLQNLSSKFLAFERSLKLGFATGHEAVEHSKTKGKPLSFGSGWTQDWIRMTNVLGRREYWESLMPIPRFDPETGRVRAKPNDGMGSGVDWHIIRNHPNSICMSGRTCLVVPGLVRHAGYGNSTWLDRDLPESDSDKEKIHGE